MLRSSLSFCSFFVLLFALTSNVAVFAETSEEEADDGAVEVDSDFTRQLFEVNITRDFRRGNNLIYDCSYQRYLCVNDDGRELCSQRRETDMEDRFYLLRCAVLQRFSRYEQCTDKQYELMHKRVNMDFCFNLKLEEQRRQPF